jgi:hypothetical protein
MNANYRKLNDHSLSSSKYHKKDGTPVRAILNRETKKEVYRVGDVSTNRVLINV